MTSKTCPPGARFCKEASRACDRYRIWHCREA